MNFLKKNETFIKPITDRLSRFLPECGGKDSLRCWFYNLLNADFKMHVLKNGGLRARKIEAIEGMKSILQSGKTAFAMASYLALEKSFKLPEDLVRSGHPIHLTNRQPKSLIDGLGAKCCAV